MNGCSSGRPGLPSAALRGFDWLVFSQAGCEGGGKMEGREEKGERWGGETRLMMKIHWWERERGISAGERRWRGDDLTYKRQWKGSIGFTWQCRSRRVCYLSPVRQRAAMSCKDCLLDGSCHSSSYVSSWIIRRRQRKKFYSSCCRIWVIIIESVFKQFLEKALLQTERSLDGRELSNVSGKWPQSLYTHRHAHACSALR